MNKIKKITKSKAFHICIIIVIITVILFIAGMLMLKYDVEGETNMPFKLSKIAVISAQEGIDTGETDTKWSFNVNQGNDIYIYIDKNENYGKTEAIKSISLNNFNIQSKNNENIKLYKPDPQEEQLIFKYKDDDIVQDIEYNADVQYDLKNLKISNQGGILAFRCSNNNVGKYKSDDEEINHSELLKKININNEDLKINISFNLNINLESDKKYQAEVSLELPVGDVINNGNASKEITNLDNIVFKRITN